MTVEVTFDFIDPETICNTTWKYYRTFLKHFFRPQLTLLSPFQ